MVFQAELRAGTSTGGPFPNDKGFFAYVDGELDLIVREGDVLPVQLDDDLIENRTVAVIYLNPTSSGGEDASLRLVVLQLLLCWELSQR